MADLSEKASSLSTKIVGANPSTGVEDNFADVDSSGALLVVTPDGTNQVVTKVISVSGSDFLEIFTKGASVANFQITGSFTGTFKTFVATNGTYQEVPVYSVVDGSVKTSITDATPFTVNCAGWKSILVQNISLSSGTPTLSGWLSHGVGITPVISQNYTSLKSSAYVTDGTNVASVLTAATSDTAQPALAVRVISQLGSASNTQYADGAARSTATGTLMMVDDGTDIQSVAGTAAGVLKVDMSATTLPAGTNILGSAKITDGTNTTAVKAASTASAATDPALVVSLSPNSPISAPTLTKATQGATGLSVQNLKDAGRSARNIILDSFAVAATSETLNTMSYSSDNGTLTTGTSYSVTTAKRLRIQQITAALHTITGNTTAVNVIVRIRANNGGAALVSSPIQLVIPLAGIASANGAGTPVAIQFPDGWEFVAGAGIGITTTCAGFVTTTAAPKVDITITGYEY